MAKILLLDGHSLAYRAFYALPADLATKDGTVTNAVYGFTSMLIKVLADERPDYLGVAFDLAGPTFRKEMDAEYKAGRKETPDLFRSQLPLVHEVLEALRVPIIEIPGYEADDVIATLAVGAAADAIDVVIVTGDRDSYQLVCDPHIKVLYNKRGVSDYALYDEAGIFERTGVTPSQYVDYAAIRGDTSDNLQGVPGIGEKTAAKLIATYHDLEGIYAHLDALSPKQRENLETARDRVFHNRAMTRLVTDLDIDVTPEQLRLGGFDTEVVKTLFNQLEFRTLWPRLLDAVGHVVADAGSNDDSAAFEIDVCRVEDRAAALAAIARAKSAGRIATDVRWNGVPLNGSLRGLSVASSESTNGTESVAVVYLDAEILDAEILGGGDGPDVRQALADLFGPSGPPMATHGAKALMHALAPIVIDSIDLDTEVIAYLLDPGVGKYPLDDLAAQYLSIELRSPDVEEGTLDLSGDAGMMDTGRRAAALLFLADPLSEALEASELTDLYERFERPLIRVLADMERRGVKVDAAFLAETSADLRARCSDLEARIHAHAGEQFNVNSTQQLRRILFEKLGLTPVKKTKTGPSTDADSLQKMAAAAVHPILEDLMRYRELEKLRSTYADALPPLIRSDGRIHATLNQIATTTGRISSEAPNLQNIPVRTNEGREMRRAFVAEAGCGLLSADYSQIELRVLAHLCEDPGLIDAFTRGADVHTITAAKVFGVPEDEVDAFQRRFAKVINYGLAYGMEAFGLGQRLDIPTGQAKEILDAYFVSFPNVKAFMESTIVEARRLGHTTTMFGRRRRITELMSDNFRIRQMGERMAQNAPVQGAAADIFKLAMIGVDTALTEQKLVSRMVLTVHDELVLEVPMVEREQVEDLVRDVMTSVCALKVPLVVDVGFGLNWAAAK